MYTKRKGFIFLKQLEGFLQQSMAKFTHIIFKDSKVEEDKVSVDLEQHINKQALLQKIQALARLRFPHRRIRSVTFEEGKILVQFTPEKKAQNRDV